MRLLGGLCSRALLVGSHAVTGLPIPHPLWCLCSDFQGGILPGGWLPQQPRWRISSKFHRHSIWASSPPSTESQPWPFQQGLGLAVAEPCRLRLFLAPPLPLGRWLLPMLSLHKPYEIVSFPGKYSSSTRITLVIKLKKINFTWEIKLPSVFRRLFYQTIKVQTGSMWDKQPITDNTEKWVLHPSHKNTDIKFQKTMHCGQL